MSILHMNSHKYPYHGSIAKRTNNLSNSINPSASNTINRGVSTFK